MHLSIHFHILLATFFAEHSLVPGWKGFGLHCPGCSRCCQVQTESVHHPHQDPRLQDGAVLHGHYGGPHRHPEAAETGHGEAAQNSENTHHSQTSGYEAQHITQWHFNPLEIHWTQVSEPLVAWLWHGVSNLWPGGHCCARQHHLCPPGNLISFYFQRNTKHGWLFTISILFSSVYEFPNSLSSSQLLHKQHHSSPSLEMQRHPDHAGDRPQPQGQWQGGGGHAQAEQPDPSQHGWW